LKRDIKKLSENEFDILIIGGGIYGATLAWRASIAGYSVALIEKNDFVSGTSSNSQKIIHGGLRYLQKLDFIRIRQSINERKRLMWLAPHLISPLPCIMPAYGHKSKGKEALSVAVKLYDLISSDRNSISDKTNRIPGGKILNKKKINDLIPCIDQHGLKGGILWYDAFCNNTERLIISFIKSAVDNGCIAANYLKAKKMIVNKNKVNAVLVSDELNQNQFEIKAKKVIACTGSEINNFDISFLRQEYVAGINIIVKKIFQHNYAVGIENRNNKRLYFAAPWKNKTIIGTDWHPAPDPDKFEFREIHVRKLIEGFNEAYPYANLTYDDVEFIHKGFVPAEKNTRNSAKTLSHFRVIDGAVYSVDGFYKIVGVKYTTAVNVAEFTLKKIFPEFERISLKSQPRLCSGNINNLEEFRHDIFTKYSEVYSKKELNNLINNYGLEIHKIIDSNKIIRKNEELNSEKSLLKAKVMFAIKEEMALHLDDVILRRTDIGSSNLPGEDEIEYISKVMSEEFRWEEKERFDEIERLEELYRLINKKSFNKQTVV
jgi:glycerol-3-phosphate dehydrogenase